MFWIFKTWFWIFKTWMWRFKIWLRVRLNFDFDSFTEGAKTTETIFDKHIKVKLQNTMKEQSWVWMCPSFYGNVRI